jgi:hypothetical protein
MSRSGPAVGQRLGWDAAIDKYIALYRLEQSALEAKSPSVEVAAR